MHQVQSQREPFTVADWVTCCRFLLAAVLALVALGVSAAPHAALGAVAGAALLTDFVDGRLARRTGTTTRLGARLDAEADAVLILVLSVVVAPRLGWWVLGLGAARYLFGALFWLVPALRTPPIRSRPWCKVVAAVVGIVLAVVAGVDLPVWLARGVVAVVGVLLAESFLHEAVDRFRAPRPPWAVRPGTLLSLGVVWVALLAPSDPGTLLRLPAGLLLVLAIAWFPWHRVRVGLAVSLGAVLGVLVLIVLLDRAFTEIFDRPFDPLGDWAAFGRGVGVLGDTIGRGWALMVTVLIGAAALGVLVGVPAAVVRTVEAARNARRPVTGFALVLALVGSPLATAGAAAVATQEVRQIRSGIADHRAFAADIRDDAVASRDPRSLLAGLSGKDVLLVFVESYGRVALQRDVVTRALEKGETQLAAAGYRSRSAFLTSPTFGAGSWLAHASLQSGLWVDSESRYHQLLRTRRLTLSRLFATAGWRTVLDVPANTRDWPEGPAFYGVSDLLDSRNVGYAGPQLGYSPVPDQYTLAHFRDAFLDPDGRVPVMAEIDLVSSHHPWTPLPRMVSWDRIGDGSIFEGAVGAKARNLGDAEMRRMYGESLAYTWRVLVSFLTTRPDPNLVVIAVGDHQPHRYVSGPDADHDVPISVISQDPDVVRRIADWHWQPGLHPGNDASVWRMDAFRDRFLSAFSR